MTVCASVQNVLTFSRRNLCDYFFQQELAKRIVFLRNILQVKVANVITMTTTIGPCMSLHHFRISVTVGEYTL